MNLLEEINKNNSSIVEKTNETCTIPLDGQKRVLPVYKIKLSALFFNDKNDRIGTFINKYKNENNIIDLDKTDKEKYNSIIEKFIVNSNKPAFEKTLNNIKKMGQLHAGVVLKDGRIIDGNRRFTCLRELARSCDSGIVGSFDYFNAVILDESNETNYRKIKILELMIQQGEDEKVDYDPIDKLVGIYNDIIKNKEITIPEYANCINKSEKFVKEECDIAQLLAEFIEFIEEKENFHWAREFKLDGPIREVFKILKKVKDDEIKYKKAKKIMFNVLVAEMSNDGDRTRKIRRFEDIITKEKYFTSFLEDNLENFSSVKDVLSEKCSFKEKINKLNSIEEVNKIKESIELNINKRNSELSKNRPIDLIVQARTNLEAIDKEIFIKLNDNTLNSVREEIEELEQVIKKIKDKINVQKN